MPLTLHMSGFMLQEMVSIVSGGINFWVGEVGGGGGRSVNFPLSTAQISIEMAVVDI